MFTNKTEFLVAALVVFAAGMIGGFNVITDNANSISNAAAVAGVTSVRSVVSPNTMMRGGSMPSAAPTTPNQTPATNIRTSQNNTSQTPTTDFTSLSLGTTDPVLCPKLQNMLKKAGYITDQQLPTTSNLCGPLTFSALNKFLKDVTILPPTNGVINQQTNTALSGLSSALDCIYVGHVSVNLTGCGKVQPGGSLFLYDLVDYLSKATKKLSPEEIAACHERHDTDIGRAFDSYNSCTNDCGKKFPAGSNDLAWCKGDISPLTNKPVPPGSCLANLWDSRSGIDAALQTCLNGNSNQ